MKFLVVAVCLIGCALAASPDEVAEILRSSYDQTPEGNYQYNYESSNGISGSAKGSLKVFDKEQAAVIVEGSNAYTSPDGQQISLSYVADENGYHPQGAHLPTPPAPEAIPEYIARSLEYIAAHPYQEKKFKRGVPL